MRRLVWIGIAVLVAAVILLLAGERKSPPALAPERIALEQRPREARDLVDVVNETQRETAAPSARGEPLVARVRDAVAGALAPEARGASLLVRLTSSRGGPLTGRGAFADASSKAGNARSRPTAVPGEVVLEDLGPGTWTVFARAPGHEPALGSVEVPDGAGTLELALELAAKPSVLVALVTPDGNAWTSEERRALDPDVRVTRERPGGALAEAFVLTSDEGCGKLHAAFLLDLDERYLGLLELACERPLWANLAIGLDLVDAQPLGPDTEEIVFVLDPRNAQVAHPSVRARIVDGATGAPIICAPGRIRLGPWRLTAAGAATDGVIVFRSVPPGPAVLEIQVHGWARERRELHIPVGVEVDLGEIALRHVGTAELVVELDLPPDLAGATVSWAPLGSLGDGRGMGEVRSQAASRDAPAVLDLGLGPWVLWAEEETSRGAFGSPLHVVELREGGTRERLVLEPLARTKVLSQAGRRAVTVLDARGLVRWEFLTRPGFSTELDLVPGSYELLATDPEGVEHRLPIVVDAGGTTVELP